MEDDVPREVLKVFDNQIHRNLPADVVRVSVEARRILLLQHHHFNLYGKRTFPWLRGMDSNAKIRDHEARKEDAHMVYFKNQKIL